MPWARADNTHSAQLTAKSRCNVSLLIHFIVKTAEQAPSAEENTNPLAPPSSVLSSLARVRADVELMQGRQLPTELTLVSWVFLLAAFSPKQEVFSESVIPLLVFLLNLPGYFDVCWWRGENWVGGAHPEPHLCSRAQRCWPSSSCGFWRGPSLSSASRCCWHTTGVIYLQGSSANCKRKQNVHSVLH